MLSKVKLNSSKYVLLHTSL